MGRIAPHPTPICAHASAYMLRCTQTMPDLLVKKPLNMIKEEVDEVGEHTLKRALGATNLIALGIGAIIGTGIFVLTGSVAAQNSGPAIVLSFIFAGIACAFAGLCYAEFASLIPDCRICLHLRLCDAGRAFRLDHRLGLDPRICLRGRYRGLRMVGQRGAIARAAGPEPAAAVDRYAGHPPGLLSADVATRGIAAGGRGYRCTSARNGGHLMWSRFWRSRS